MTQAFTHAIDPPGPPQGQLISCIRERFVIFWVRVSFLTFFFSTASKHRTRLRDARHLHQAVRAGSQPRGTCQHYQVRRPDLEQECTRAYLIQFQERIYVVGTNVRMRISILQEKALLTQSWQSRPSLGCLLLLKQCKNVSAPGIKLVWQC